MIEGDFRKEILTNRFLYILAVCIPMVLSPALSFSQEEHFSLIVKSKYFYVYGYKNMDINSLLEKLDFECFSPCKLFKDNDAKSILAETIDCIFLKVSVILDAHVYSFHGEIRILSDRGAVNSVYRKYFDKDCPERSFYSLEKNAIYISFADLTPGMLGHEISHAVISSFFVVQPSIKIHEILCCYVEYTIRKLTDKPR